MLGSFLGIGFTSMATTLGLWTLGHGAVHVSQRADRAAQQVQGRLSQQLRAGPGRNQVHSAVRRVGRELRIQRQAARSTPCASVCTHLGCTPNWLEGEQKFKCPCHGSGFYKDGINFEGPAPRPLERYAIRIGRRRPVGSRQEQALSGRNRPVERPCFLRRGVSPGACRPGRVECCAAAKARPPAAAGVARPCGRADVPRVVRGRRRAVRLGKWTCFFIRKAR